MKIPCGCIGRELKRLVLQVDWLRLRNLAACVGQTVEKKTVVPFALMKLKRRMRIEHQEELESSALRLSQVMVQGEEFLQEYLFPVMVVAWTKGMCSFTVL